MKIFLQNCVTLFLQFTVKVIDLLVMTLWFKLRKTSALLLKFTTIFIICSEVKISKSQAHQWNQSYQNHQVNQQVVYLPQFLFHTITLQCNSNMKLSCGTGRSDRSDGELCADRVGLWEEERRKTRWRKRGRGIEISRTTLTHIHCVNAAFLWGSVSSSQVWTWNKHLSVLFLNAS